MAPTRRYLRLTAHTVLEVRIYLDNPADTHRWLLHPASPALPTVISTIRPLVLPRLEEENARASSKAGGKGSNGSKKKGWKDVVHTDQFEVGMFFADKGVRHSILKREKLARGVANGRSGLEVHHGTVGATSEKPMLVGDEDEGEEAEKATHTLPALRREESEGSDHVRLRNVPLEGESPRQLETQGISRSHANDDDDDDHNMSDDAANGAISRRAGEEGDDKKKLALDTEYDGFSIYGQILCLLVRRKGQAKGTAQKKGAAQATMEGWISSSQMGVGTMIED